MASPFDNAYSLRKVAEADAKSCTVCYKPSTSVLITSDSKDFFYVCPGHLKDEHFASPIHSETYTNLVAEKTKLETELKALSVKVDQKKPGLFQYIPGFGSKEEQQDKAKDEKETYKTLLAKKEQLVAELEGLTKQIDQFAFKNFKLHPDMFRVRWRNYVNKKVNEKRVRDMMNPGFFPQVPSSQASTSSSATKDDSSSDI